MLVLCGSESMGEPEAGRWLLVAACLCGLHPAEQPGLGVWGGTPAGPPWALAVGAAPVPRGGDGVVVMRAASVGDQWSGRPAAKVLHVPCDLHGSPRRGAATLGFVPGSRDPSPATDRQSGGGGEGRFWNLKRAQPPGAARTCQHCGRTRRPGSEEGRVSPATGGKRHTYRRADHLALKLEDTGVLTCTLSS